MSCNQFIYLQTKRVRFRSVFRNFRLVESTVLIPGPVGSSRLPHRVLLLPLVQPPELLGTHLQDARSLAMIHIVEAPRHLQ